MHTDIIFFSFEYQTACCKNLKCQLNFVFPKIYKPIQKFIFICMNQEVSTKGMFLQNTCIIIGNNTNTKYIFCRVCNIDYSLCIVVYNIRQKVLSILSLISKLTVTL